jgi:hypothetical protein
MVEKETGKAKKRYRNAKSKTTTAGYVKLGFLE